MNSTVCLTEPLWLKLRDYFCKPLAEIESSRHGFDTLKPMIEQIKSRVRVISESALLDEKSPPAVADPVDLPRQGHKRHGELAELAGHRAAYDWVVERYTELEPSNDTLLEMHRRLYIGQHPGAGRFKRGEVRVMRRRLDEKIENLDMDHTVPAAEVERELQTIHEMFRVHWGSGRIDKVLLAAGYFADLLKVHPFSDGNGRTARHMFSLILMRAGHPAVPYLDLHYLFDAHRTAYLSAAQCLDMNGVGDSDDARAFIGCLLELLVSAYTGLEKRVDRLSVSLPDE